MVGSLGLWFGAQVGAPLKTQGRESPGVVDVLCFNVLISHSTQRPTPPGWCVVAYCLAANDTYQSKEEIHYEGEHNVYDDVFDMNALGDEMLSEILTREYVIDRMLWTSTSAADTAIGCYLFPHNLFLQTNIWAKLQRYAFIRGDIELRVRVQGSAMNCGALLLSSLPYYDPTVLTGNPDTTNEFSGKLGNMYAASAAKTLYLDASLEKEYVMLIPCRIPTAYLDIDDYAAGLCNPGSFGTAVLRVLHPLTTLTGVTPQIRVTISARFASVHVAGKTPHDRLTYAGKGSVVNLANLVVANSSEGEVKSREGIISGPALRAKSIFKSLRKLPVIGGAMGSAATVADLFARGAKAFGYDKPTTVAATQHFHYGGGRDMHSGVGLDTSVSLSVVPSPQVNDDPEMIGDRDDHLISALANRLSLVRAYSWAADTLPDTRYTIPVSPIEVFMSTPDLVRRYYNTPTSWVARFFKFWRGGMKYRMVFSCAGLTSAQVAISWVPRVDDESLVNGAGGDWFRKIVDVRGTTTVDFMIPYASAELWKYGGSAKSWLSGYDQSYYQNELSSNGALIVTLLNPPNYGGATTGTRLNVSIWSTVAEDIQFADFGEDRTLKLWKDLTPYSNAGGMNIGPPAGNFDVGPFEPLVEGNFVVDAGVCFGERIDDIRSLAHTYSSVTTGSVVLPLTLQDSSGLDLYHMNRVDRLTQIFMFKRGARRFKLVPPVGGASLLLATYKGTTSSLTEYFPQSLASDATVEVPYYVPWSFEIQRTAQTSAGYLPQRTLAAYPVDVTVVSGYLGIFQANGDDVTFGTICAPPSTFYPYNEGATPPTRGTL